MSSIRNTRRDSYSFLDDMTERLRFEAPDNQNADQPSVLSVPTWDEYFHAIAQVAALRSKDQRKVGAVIVGSGETILSTGFNGFARGIRETPARVAEDEKLLWVTHAETNAIFNAARNGVSLVGSTIYVTLFPCAGCAQAIVQAGIKRVFSYADKYWVKAEPDLPNRWEIALDILAEAHVAVDAPNLRAEEVRYWTDKNERANTAKLSGRRKLLRGRPQAARVSKASTSKKR